MSKLYKKKPITVEAFQWNECLSIDEQPDWFIKAREEKIVWFIDTIQGLVCKIDTLEGIMKVSNGDYIIKGIKGEIYPCKSDIFEATYDEIGFVNPNITGVFKEKN